HVAVDERGHAEPAQRPRRRGRNRRQGDRQHGPAGVRGAGRGWGGPGGFGGGKGRRLPAPPASPTTRPGGPRRRPGLWGGPPIDERGVEAIGLMSCRRAAREKTVVSWFEFFECHGGALPAVLRSRDTADKARPWHLFKVTHYRKDLASAAQFLLDHLADDLR